jgi:NADPH:quinone reductase-like Zn-dependent oxidoreductase
MGEYAAVPAVQCLPMPAGVSLIDAGGLPETFCTVWTNVFERMHLQAGEVFLVQGGSSGIGVTAIQLAKAFGAEVLATAGSDEKCRACRDYGADLAINYRTQDFVQIGKNTSRLRCSVVHANWGGQNPAAKSTLYTSPGMRLIKAQSPHGMAWQERDLMQARLSQLARRFILAGAVNQQVE